MEEIENEVIFFLLHFYSCHSFNLAKTQPAGVRSRFPFFTCTPLCNQRKAWLSFPTDEPLPLRHVIIFLPWEQIPNTFAYTYKKTKQIKHEITGFLFYQDHV